MIFTLIVSNLVDFYPQESNKNNNKYIPSVSQCRKIRGEKKLEKKQALVGREVEICDFWSQLSVFLKVDFWSRFLERSSTLFSVLSDIDFVKI